jgi:hypothetical protein
MGNNYVIYALIVVAIVFLLARMLSIRGMRYLNQEQKGILVALMRRMSKYQLLILMALIAGLIALMQFRDQLNNQLVILSYFVLLVLFTASRSIYLFGQLRKQHFPKAYLNSMIFSTALQSLAIIAFAYLLYDMATLPKIQ